MYEIVSVPQRVINAAIINANTEIFLVQKGSLWILPGGKPQEHESDLDCLIREIGEELSGTLIEHNITPYKDFRGISPHTKNEILVSVYFARFGSEVYAPSAEIRGVAWMKNPKAYALSETSLDIVNCLINDKHL